MGSKAKLVEISHSRCSSAEAVTFLSGLSVSAHMDAWKWYMHVESSFPRELRTFCICAAELICARSMPGNSRCLVMGLGLLDVWKSSANLQSLLIAPGQKCGGLDIPWLYIAQVKSPSHC